VWRAGLPAVDAVHMAHLARSHGRSGDGEVMSMDELKRYIGKQLRLAYWWLWLHKPRRDR
jgi:hypothetical protein